MDDDDPGSGGSGLPAAIARALTHVAERLDAAGVTWLVSGSCARALTGFRTEPRDLDIEVAGSEVRAAAAALDLEATIDHDDRARSLRAVGSVGSCEIDLIAGLALTGPGGVLPADFDLMATYARSVRVGGRSVRVTPVEEQMVRILVSGDEARRARFVAEAPAGFIAQNDYVELRLGSARAAR